MLLPFICENGIMGNMKASETTALIGSILFNMAAPQEDMDDNHNIDLLVHFLTSLPVTPIRHQVVLSYWSLKTERTNQSRCFRSPHYP